MIYEDNGTIEVLGVNDAEWEMNEVNLSTVCPLDKVGHDTPVDPIRSRLKNFVRHVKCPNHRSGIDTTPERWLVEGQD